MILWSIRRTEATPTLRSLRLGECGSGLRPRRGVEDHLSHTPLEPGTRAKRASYLLSCLWSVVCGLLSIVYCLLSLVCCLLSIVYCLLSIVCCLLSVVRLSHDSNH